MRSVKNFFPAFLLISLFAQSSIFGQSAVFQPSSLSKISLAAQSKPVSRELSMKKWFPAREGKEAAWTDFQAFLKQEGIYITPPLKDWLGKTFFLESGNDPNAETWLLQDGTEIFIRHFDPTKQDNTVEIYTMDACVSELCTSGGFSKKIQYDNKANIIKFDPKIAGVYAEFQGHLVTNNIRLRNYLMREIKEQYFNQAELTKDFPNDEFVTWTLITPSKIIIRQARKNEDLNFKAISIPYVPWVSQAWSLLINVDVSGFSTTNKEVTSYMDIAAGYTLTRKFYNGWGELNFSNIGSFGAHFEDNEELERPTTYRALDTIYVDQELIEYLKLFGQLDGYHDSAIGIIFGARILPGIAYNFLGYGNRYGFDPEISYAAGYRYELDDLGTVKNPQEETFRDVIFSYRISIGNIDYGSASFYWKLAAEYQHSFFTQSTLTDESKLLGIDENFRINYMAQLGLPLFTGTWKLYFSYLQEQIHDQLGEITNHSGILSFEAKVL